MSAFGSPWGDLDRTPANTPYVVDSDGWGWFALFLIFALPFFCLGILITQLAETVCAHPHMTVFIYLIISSVFSFIFNIRMQQRFKILGIFATILAMIPFMLVQVLYLIPYIVQNSLFASVFEWIIVTAVIGGISFFILAISNVIRNGMIQLTISMIFLAVTIVILHSYISSSEDINWSFILSLYNL